MLAAGFAALRFQHPWKSGLRANDTARRSGFARALKAGRSRRVCNGAPRRGRAHRYSRQSAQEYGARLGLPVGPSRTDEVVARAWSGTVRTRRGAMGDAKGLGAKNGASTDPDAT